MGSLTERRQDIEQAKGLAILFVVFGHIVARADQLRVEWYEPIRRAIYAFHMPFFLYLSGYVAVLSGALFLPPEKWRRLFASRARRLLVPFLTLGLLTVCGKIVAAFFVFVDNRPASLATVLENLLWHTADSPALSIWYLFVLFTLSITAPILVWLDRGRLRYFIISAALIYLTPLPSFVYLDHIGKYSIFFALGAWAATIDVKWNDFIDRYWAIFFIPLVGALIMVAGFGAAWPVKLELLPIGIVSMPALHGLIRHGRLPFAPIFLWLGQNCFMIYLFNTICIGLAKGILLRVTDWDGSHFLPFAIVLMAAGSLGPILLKKTVFQRVRLIGRHTT
jgi:fucose 4-O-acetylase-like acetyltransferase